MSDATLIANGGVGGGGGGQIVFNENVGSSTARPRVQVYGNGSLSIGGAFSPITIGSIEGDGIVSLDDRQLIVGTNDLSTTFSGTINGSGLNPALTKVGAGTLTLIGANTYAGLTTVSAGVLSVNNQTGSGTGTGAVTVTVGTLAGHGIIAGPVTVGTGSGAGAFLSPSKGAHHPGTLTLQSSLTFKADGTYDCKLNMRRARADQVIVDGVTIESGAQFNLYTFADRTLPIGTVFSTISNTSADPISGTFSNLPDGGIVTINGNNLQASYERTATISP